MEYARDTERAVFQPTGQGNSRVHQRTARLAGGSRATNSAARRGTLEVERRMRAVDLIRKKRDNGEHSREEIDFLVSAYTSGEIPDYQMAAWLMATWLRGLNRS